VLPVTAFVHAAGQGPHIHVSDWLVFVLVMIGASTVTASMGRPGFPAGRGEARLTGKVYLAVAGILPAARPAIV